MRHVGFSFALAVRVAGVLVVGAAVRPAAAAAQSVGVVTGRVTGPDGNAISAE